MQVRLLEHEKSHAFIIERRMMAKHVYFDLEDKYSVTPSGIEFCISEQSQGERLSDK